MSLESTLERIATALEQHNKQHAEHLAVIRESNAKADALAAFLANGGTPAEKKVRSKKAAEQTAPAAAVVSIGDGDAVYTETKPAPAQPDPVVANVAPVPPKKEEATQRCTKCAAVLDAENSSKLTTGVRVHVRCPADEQKAAEPTVAAVSPNGKVTIVDEQPTAEPVKPPTLVQLREAAQVYANTHGRDSLIELIVKHTGGEAKLVAIPEEKRAAFLQDCTAAQAAA